MYHTPGARACGLSQLEVSNRPDFDCTWRQCTAHVMPFSTGLECPYASSCVLLLCILNSFSTKERYARLILAACPSAHVQAAHVQRCHPAEKTKQDSNYVCCRRKHWFLLSTQASLYTQSSTRSVSTALPQKRPAPPQLQTSSPPLALTWMQQMSLRSLTLMQTACHSPPVLQSSHLLAFRISSSAGFIFTLFSFTLVCGRHWLLAACLVSSSPRFPSNSSPQPHWLAATLLLLSATGLLLQQQ